MTTFSVTSATDNGLGDTEGTLSYAILQANQLPGDDTISMNTDVRVTGVMKTLVNSNITIAGNNHSLSGDVNNNGINDSGDVRPLFILSGSVNISDLSITNGRAQGGNGGGGGGGGLGGGLFIYDGDVSLTNVAFTNNIAQGGRGGDYGGAGGGMFGNASGGGGGLFGNAVSDDGGYGGNGNYGGFGGKGGFTYDDNFNNKIDGGFGGGGGGRVIVEAALYRLVGGGGGFGGGAGVGVVVKEGGFGGGGAGGDKVGSRGGYGGGGAPGGGFFRGGSGGFGGGAGKGYGDGYYPRGGGGGAGLGGGIFVRSGSLTLNNTRFTGNTAEGGTGFQSGKGLGGAIFIMQSTTNTNDNNQGMPSVLPTVTSVGNPTFSGNSAADDASTATNNDNVYGTINLTSLNTPPVANPDTVSATANTPIKISVNTLLANDTDADGDPLTLTGVSNFTGGTAVLDDNGTPSSSADDYITFTPTTGFSDNASFDYSISDGKGGTSSATVIVAVGTVQNGGTGHDTLTGNDGNDILIGGTGEDTLIGNAGDDTLIGGNGTDLLLGNAGDDLLYGGNGTDTLRGGLGNDTLTGGNGGDVFVFASGEGTDTITDFKLSNDKIGLTGGLTFENLSFSGNKIIFDTQVLAVLTGVNTNTLTASNFLTV